MENNLHREFARIKGEFRQITEKLSIHSYHSEVCGPWLDVSIISGDQELKVYGLNDGHRGCGWIHYNEKVENDLFSILKTELDSQAAKDRIQELKENEKKQAEQERINKILSSY